MKKNSPKPAKKPATTSVPASALAGGPACQKEITGAAKCQCSNCAKARVQ